MIMKKYIILLLSIISSYSLFAQADFDIISFADTLKYNWDTPVTRYAYRENLDFKKSLLNKYENERLNISLNMGKSLIIPGWGHFHTKDYLRGQVLLSSEIILAGSTFFLYEKAMDRYNKYKKATQIDQINQYYQEANDSYKQASLTTALFILVWAYNVYDTYLVTNQYNDRLWINNIQKEVDRKITVTPNGISIKF
jgi:hypothetical protein